MKYSNVTDVLDASVEVLEHGLKSGLSTGWTQTDTYYTVRGGDITILTGAPGSGKSEWLDHLCFNMMQQHGWKIAYCSFENDKEEHLLKLAEKYLNKPYYKIQGQMTCNEFEAACKYFQDRVFFMEADDSGIATIEAILELGAKLHKDKGINGLVIDPYNYLEYSSDLREDLFVSNVLTKSRNFVRQTNCHLWFVAHPRTLRYNSGDAMPVPSLYDISGGSNWANKADCGLVFYRDLETNINTLHIKKIRRKSVGKLGAVSYDYNPKTGKFYEQF